MSDTLAPDISNLVGAWTLSAAEWELAETGERFDMYGPNPRGCISFAATGRMVALVTSSSSAPPKTDADRAALTRTMMAYSGKFRLEGGVQFITSVDLAWHPAWIGTEQLRFFKIENDTLSIWSREQTHPSFPGKPVRGHLSWNRDR
jgi:hypothetical protein